MTVFQQPASPRLFINTAVEPAKAWALKGLQKQSHELSGALFKASKSMCDAAEYGLYCEEKMLFEGSRMKDNILVVEKHCLTWTVRIHRGKEKQTQAAGFNKPLNNVVNPLSAHLGRH